MALQSELLIRKYSRRTIRAYIKHNMDFLLFIDRKPDEIKNEDIKNILLFSRAKESGYFHFEYCYKRFEILLWRGFKEKVYL